MFNLCQDVGTRDNARASKFEVGLSMDDDVEGVTREGMVDFSLTLGLVEGVGGNEDGGVATINHAVVEEEAKGSSGRDRAGDLFIGDSFTNDLLEVGTGVLVITKGEFGVNKRGEGEGKGDGDNNEEK